MRILGILPSGQELEFGTFEDRDRWLVSIGERPAGAWGAIDPETVDYYHGDPDRDR